MEKLIWIKTLKRFASVAASSVLVVGLNTLATLYITRLLSPDEYGQWLYFLSWFGLFRLLLGLGLGPKIIRDLSEVRDNVRELNRRFWNVMTVRAGTIASVLIVILIVTTILHIDIVGTPLLNSVQALAYGRDPSPDTSRNPQHRNVLDIAAAAAVISILAVLADSTLSTTAGLHKVAAHNLVLVAQPLIYMGGIAVVFGFGDGTLLGGPSVGVVTGLYGLSYILAFLIGVVAVLRTGLLHLNLMSTTTDALRSMRAFRFVGGMYGVAILTYLFSVVGTMWLGTHQYYDLTAAFGVPFNLVMLPGSIAQTAIVSTFYPSLCELLGQRKQHHPMSVVSARTLLTRFIQGVVIVAVIGCLVLALYPRPILRIVYSEKYVDAARTLTLLSPMVILVPVELLMVYTYAALGQLARPLLGYGAQLGALILGGGLVGSAVLPGDMGKGLAVVYLVVKILGVVGLGIGLYREFSTVGKLRVQV
jgi:O-antigen/teichoic acid export membrane protein